MILSVIQMLNRRTFIESAAASAVLAGGLAAQTNGEWGSPVLDIHLHLKQNDGNFEHIEGSGVRQAILLTPADRDEIAKAAMAAHPGRYARFVSADITKPDGIAKMRKCLQDGAIGLGEIKFHVAVDGPEMRAVYQLASEFDVPVTIHFQEDHAVTGEFTTPFKSLPAMIREYPKTKFIGHANAFWANISADVPPETAYPTGKVKPGGLTDRMLSEFPNLYADMSANSGRNALGRDPDFAAKFLDRHQDKLMFGCDCPCKDGHGTGQVSQAPLIKGKCVARETLTALKQLASPAVFRKLVWENGHRLLKVKV
jgi:predicted TIM-barrel fold metal-dependent hydrolase